MTVLVVGASGYLGRSVVDTLRREGIETHGTYYGNAIDGASYRYDLFEDDPETLPSSAVDTVVFAAHVERTGHDFETFAAATGRFVDAIRDAGPRLVYASSAGVFDGGGRCDDESTTPRPKSRYGRRLLRFEQSVATHPDSCVFRVDYLFGRSRGTLDSRLTRTRRLVREGRRVPYYVDMFKSPCHVREAGRALATLAVDDATGVVHAPAPRTSAWAFHRAGTVALGENARLVVPEPMPDDPTLHRDSSLSSTRFERLCGFRPRSVVRAMQVSSGADRATR